MISPPFNVLFICIGNAARSIMTESLLNHWGNDKFAAYSAGSFPTGKVHPAALRLLKSLGTPTASLRSKGWDEFATPSAPAKEFVFAVCEQAAGEVCPVWPGQPLTAHGGLPDPAAADGSEIEEAAAFRILENRIKLFVARPIASLNRMSLARRVESIGRTRPDAAEEHAT